MKIFFFSTLIAIVAFIAGGILLGTSEFSNVKTLAFMKTFEFNFDEESPKLSVSLKDLMNDKDFSVNSEELVFDSNKIEEIDISGITSNIEISGENDNAQKIKVEIECLSEHEKLCKNLISLKDPKVLHIALSNEPKLLLVKNLIKSLNIEIPKNSLKKLKLNIGAGDIEIEDVLLSNAELKLGAGNISLEEVTVDSLIIKNGAGNIKLSSLDLKKKLDIKNGTGDIEVSTLNADPNVDIKCGTCNLEFKVKSLEKDFRLKAKTGMGSVALPSEDKGVVDGFTVFGKGTGLVVLKSGVGSIKVK